LDVAAFGVTAPGATLASPAPETFAAAFPETLLALAPCVFAYQKYAPAPAAIKTTAAVTKTIRVLPVRLRSAAFAESS
jgi:hypothetical protein